VPNDVDPTIVAYGARVGLELGCDLLKVKYTGSKDTFKKVVDMAGRAKVLCAGGLKSDLDTFLKQTRDILDVGAAGVAVGRNVWQSDDPDKVSKALERIIFEDKSVQDALKG
jgi:class I fructose-bisphosphate aldolase